MSRLSQRTGTFPACYGLNLKLKVSPPPHNNQALGQAFSMGASLGHWRTKLWHDGLFNATKFSFYFWLSISLFKMHSAMTTTISIFLLLFLTKKMYVGLRHEAACCWPCVQCQQPCALYTSMHLSKNTHKVRTIYWSVMTRGLKYLRSLFL